MRILIVVHGYPPTFMGGAELRAERTARDLAARKHDVAVLCIESLSALATRLVSSYRPQDGVMLHRLHVRPTVLDGGEQDYDRLAVREALDQLIRDWHPEVIHLFSGYLMGVGVIDLAVAHGVPIVVSLTDYWWLCHRINLVRTNGSRCEGPTPVDCARCHNEMYRRFRLPANAARLLVDGFWFLADQIPALGEQLGLSDHAERLQVMVRTLNRANALIAPSRFLGSMYVRYGVDPARMHIWRQGVNLSLCPLRKPSSGLRFGYLGQIKQHKGVHTLIDAWSRLRGSDQISLVIYGTDRGEEAYGAQLRKRTRNISNITWAPMVEQSEIWQILAQLDVLVVPSRWNENSPNVILEAQAMGVVLIGSNLGGVAELIQHEQNGLLFTPDRPDDLAAQIQRLCDDPGLLAQLRKQLLPFRSFVDEIDKIEGLYEQFIADSPARSRLGQLILND